MAFDLSTFRLNSPLGKRILATTREGNYAHPGEEEAIVKTLAPFVRGANQHWLDAGCGRGGTAAFIRQKGWARVTAFDIDTVSIQEARKTYPDVTFQECGVLDAPKVITEHFDLIYAFNAFYAFPDQAGSLRALRSLATEASTLVLFDYIDRRGFHELPLARWDEALHWQPIKLQTFAKTLTNSGWKLETVHDLDVDYARWYEWLLARFDSRREAIREFAPTEAIDHTRAFFSLLLEAIRSGVLGGGITVARAS